MPTPLRARNCATMQFAVDHAVDETLARCTDLAAAGQHLQAMRAAAIENADAFR